MQADKRNPSEVEHDPKATQHDLEDAPALRQSTLVEPSAEGLATSHAPLSAGRILHPTGEHPPVHSRGEDEPRQMVARAAMLPLADLEQISSTQHEHEPDDELPDLLDQNR